jgi:hypothetical protein
MMAGLRGGAGGNMGKFLIDDAGAGKGGARRILYRPGGRLHDARQGPQDLALAAAPHSLAVKHLAFEFLGVPPRPAPVGASGDRRRLPPIGGLRDREIRQTDRGEVGASRLALRLAQDAPASVEPSGTVEPIERWRAQWARRSSRQRPSFSCTGRSEKLNSTASPLGWWVCGDQLGTTKMSRGFQAKTVSPTRVSPSPSTIV